MGNFVRSLLSLYNEWLLTVAKEKEMKEKEKEKQEKKEQEVVLITCTHEGRGDVVVSGQRKCMICLHLESIKLLKNDSMFLRAIANEMSERGDIRYIRMTSISISLSGIAEDMESMEMEIH